MSYSSPRPLVESAIQPGDLGQINSLLCQLSHRAPTLKPHELLTICWHTHLLVTREVVTTEGEGSIIGMATLVMYRKPTGLVGVVEDVVVDAAHRGKGIARALMVDILRYARGQQCRFLELTSNPKNTDRRSAISLCRSLGFVRRRTNIYRFEL